MVNSTADYTTNRMMMNYCMREKLHETKNLFIFVLLIVIPEKSLIQLQSYRNTQRTEILLSLGL